MRFDLKDKFKRLSSIRYLSKLLRSRATIEIKELKQKRSIDQNSLYWLWLSAIERETGNVKEEVHVLYRISLLSRDEEDITKVIIPKVWFRVKELACQFHYIKDFSGIVDFVAKSTTELDTKEMTNYLDSIKKHALNNFGVTLLNLEDRLFKEFYSEYR